MENWRMEGRDRRKEGEVMKIGEQQVWTGEGNKGERRKKEGQMGREEAKKRKEKKVSKERRWRQG